MKTTFTKEIFLLLITALPLIVLSILWSDLPKSVPIHFNLSGEADNWTDKEYLPYLYSAFLFGTYLLLLAIPMIDPKGQISKMGDKFYMIRIITMALLAGVFCLTTFTAMDGYIYLTKYLPHLLFLFLAIFGNYMQTIKPNYFVGIRTPWTLEDPENWRKTHRMGGRLLMFGGLALFISALFLPPTLQKYLLLGGTLLLALIPIGYSFYLYLKSKNTSE